MSSVPSDHPGSRGGEKTDNELGVGAARTHAMSSAAAGRKRIIMVVDDDEGIRDVAQGLLEEEYQIVLAVDGIDALEQLHARRVDLILTDLVMPRLDGLGLVRAVRAEPSFQRIPVIVMTSHGDAVASDGVRAGADDFITKPFILSKLLTRIRVRLELAELRAEAESARQSATTILESITDGFCAFDRDWRVTHLNREGERILGRKRSELLGKVIWEEYADVVGSKLYEACHVAVERHMTAVVEYFYPRLNAWLDVRAYPGDEGSSVFFRDISRRKWAEESARMNEQWLQLIVESAQDYAILSVDMNRRVTSWNSGAEHIFGYKAEEIVGKSADVIFTAEDRDSEQPRREVSIAVERGSSEDERWHLRKDGTRVYVSGMVRPMRGPDGALQGFTKVCRDVTEKMRAAEALQESEARYRGLVEVSPQIVWIGRSDGRITYCNQRWYDLTGLPEEETIGHAWAAAVHPDYREKALSTWVDAAKSGSGYELELPFCAKDGTYRWHLTRGVPMAGSVAGSDRWIGIAIDIHDRKRVEEALRHSEEHFRLLVEGVQEYAIIMLDVNGIVVSWNSGAERIEGYTSEEIVGQNFSRFYTPEQIAEGRPQRVLQTAAAEGRYREEGWRVRKDGSFFWATLVVTPLRDRDGHLRGFSKVIGDITARKKAEAEREQLLSDLRANDQRKDEFLAMLAHELRNPLAAAKNAVGVLTVSGDEEDAHWAQQVLQRQIGQLTHIVDDLLDVSRITSGKIRLRKEILDAGAVVRHAAESVQPLVEARSHELLVAVDESLPLPVEADAARLEQIIVNLLTNAAKYTEVGGKIWLGAQREGTDVVVTVRDTGIGIPPEKLPQMFELFAQGERSIARSEGGLGLGLTIVKTLTEMHGGTITAASPGVGKGSMFSLRIPATTASISKPLEKSGAMPKAPKGGARVLVVDDNVDTARGMSRLLKLAGFQIEMTHDGHGALAAARRFEPHFILLDIGLPGIDGYGVASRLRSEGCCRDATIIAVSGYGQQEDRRRSKEAGCDFHLVKPVDYTALKSLLTSHHAAESDSYSERE